MREPYTAQVEQLHFDGREPYIAMHEDQALHPELAGHMAQLRAEGNDLGAKVVNVAFHFVVKHPTNGASQQQVLAAVVSGYRNCMEELMDTKPETPNSAYEISVDELNRTAFELMQWQLAERRHEEAASRIWDHIDAYQRALNLL